MWDYIRENNIEYCKLYDEGFTRIGCVLCPMVGDIERQISRWPKIARAWEKAIKTTWNPDSDKRVKFQTAQAYWEWWLDRTAPSFKKDESQLVLFEDDPWQG